MIWNQSKKKNNNKNQSKINSNESTLIQLSEKELELVSGGYKLIPDSPVKAGIDVF